VRFFSVHPSSGNAVITSLLSEFLHAFRSMMLTKAISLSSSNPKIFENLGVELKPEK